eukprot:7377227-Prymnesium_polylepis.2
MHMQGVGMQSREQLPVSTPDGSLIGEGRPADVKVVEEENATTTMVELLQVSEWAGVKEIW